MKPWIGRNYFKQRQRVLILGESWYEACDTKTEICYITSWIAREAPGKSDRFFSRIFNACNSKHSSRATEEERRAFWATVAFTNLVSQSVGQKARIRPNGAHWKKGIHRLCLLLPIIKCDSVFILGHDTAAYAIPLLKSLGIRYVRCPHPSGFGVSTATLQERWRNVIRCEEVKTTGTAQE